MASIILKSSHIAIHPTYTNKSSNGKIFVIHIYPVEHVLFHYMAIKTNLIYNKQNIKMFYVGNILLYMFK